MPTYIVLTNFTDQGLRDIKDTTKRADAFKALAKASGATVKDIYWTLGAHDLVGIVEAPNDETLTRALLALGAQGNVRTTTLRAFSAEEFAKLA